ncbi:MAG: NTP transferase domain-containing protein [Acidimicrobiia bacterium]|nr:NTP transferase domain-containing protein [Acidimicrobiia bacterium]
MSALGVDLAAIVLAAGSGSRMRSGLRKPLHPLAGAPMLAHVVDALGACRPDRIVVVLGPDDEIVAKEMQTRTAHLPLEVTEQPAPRGTGDAAACGLAALGDPAGDPEAGELLIVPGDAPLLRPATLRELVAHHLASGAACTLLTARVEAPSGYGRVVRGPEGSVRGIVEQADASPDELAIDEICTSVYVVRRSFCGPALRRIRPDNAAGEFYLTDIVQVLARMGHRVDSFTLSDATEAQGVNDQAQLAAARAEVRRRVIDGWLREGVSVVDPHTTHIDVTVRLAAGVVLRPGTILEGHTVVGSDAVIGPYTRLVDCAVGAGAVVEMSQGTDAEVGPDERVGPFASLGPATAP